MTNLDESLNSHDGGPVPRVSKFAINDEIRVIQSVHVQRSLPTQLAGNVGAIAIIIYLNWAAVWNSHAWIALVVILLLLIPMLRSYLRLRNRPRPETVSRRRIRIIVIHSLLLGVVWSIALLMLFPFLYVVDGMLVFMVIMFLSYGAVALMPSVPMASTAYSFPILLAAFVAGILNHLMPSDILVVLYAAGALAIIKTMMQNWEDANSQVRLSLERLDAQTELHRQEAEAAILERNQQSAQAESMRAMIDTIPFPLIMTRSNHALMASAQAARQFAVPMEKLPEFAISDFFVDPAQLEALLEIQNKQGFVEEFECELKDLKGNRFWALLSNRPVEYQGENCRLNALYIIDDRRRAEQALSEKEAQLRLTLNHMNGGIRMVDENRNYIFFNSRYSELYDFPKDLLKVGEPSRIENLYRAKRGDMGPGDPEELTDAWLAKYPVLSEPTRLDHTTNTGRTLEVYTSPTPVGGFINVVTDISERKLIEAERELAEQVALEKTRILEQTLEHMGQGLTMYDANWNLVTYNRRYMEHFDLDESLFHETATFDDIVGATMGLDYGPERDERLKVVKDPSRMTDIWRREFTRPGGRSLDVLSNPIPTGGFVVTTTDISDRMNAEAELSAKEEQLRAALDNMSDGILMVDQEMRVSMRNDRYLTLMNLDPETVPLGGKVYDAAKILAAKGFYGPGDPEQLARERHDHFARQEVASMEFHTPEGRDLEVRQEPTPDGAAVITYTDITKRKEYEAEIEAAMNKAENLARLRADFVATVSHEVRTPMNGVLGMSQLLMEMKLDDESRECVEIILRSGNSLLRIVDDLLDIAKMDAERLELEKIPFHLDDVVADAIQLMDIRAIDRGLQLSHSIDPTVPAVLLGDPFRLRQILLNLISNAIKFTDAGSVRVEVTVAALEQEQTRLQIDVVDTGKGISEDAHEKLFSEYTQESIDVARKYGGTGLGLAICRRLAGIMGGEIILQSKLQKGSTFRMNLPFAIDHETDVSQLRNGAQGDVAALAELPVASSRSLSILQVEDDEINREVVKRTLTGAKHKVTSVHDGLAALELLQQQRFDIILMDRHMPEMNGLDATRHIRQMPGEISATPILGITASAVEAELAACLEAGMNEVLTKPINRRQLLHALDRLTGGADGLPPPRNNGTILVIDDIEINHLLAKKFLQKLNLPCRFAGNGEIALELAMREEFAAILVDISMPQLDGLAFIELLRDWERLRGRRTPVIAMSGHREPGDRQRYLDAGMDGFFHKPIDLEKVSETLGPWLTLPGIGAPEISGTKDVSTEVLDLSIMVEIYGSIDADAKDMLALYCSTVDNYIAAFGASLTDDDLEAAITAVHSAAGASWNAGAKQLGSLFSRLERLLHEEGLEPVRTSTGEIADARQRFAAEYSKL